MSFNLKSKADLYNELEQLNKIYQQKKSDSITLDLSRGKPGYDQVDLSNEMLDVLNSDSDFSTPEGFDCRNYGVLDGISSIKSLFADMLDVNPCNIFVGGNSSLNMMFDTVSHLVTHGISGCKPWFGQNVKFLCPVPGYDRHFSITEYFNIEMISVPMDDNGPDMDMVENLVENDELIKGIWCVPKYSNPSGITYSDEVVKRFANLKPKAKDFRIFWDNAYCLHDISDTPDTLLNIMTECEKTGNQDLPIIFCSTSKITFPGSGIAAMAASDNNINAFKNRYCYQTIGYDKLNQLRHIRFLKDIDTLKAHMKKHGRIIKPRFDVILDYFDREFKDINDITWTSPKGGYFIALKLPNGCAKRAVSLCSDAGLILTPAGATHPYGVDPDDSTLRIAPTFSSVDDISKASDLLCLCVKIAVLEKALDE
ncbi:MAG: aminotransferase [Clostridia bacterium]|nr:aminotransferase [Clostridia bacterium]